MENKDFLVHEIKQLLVSIQYIYFYILITNVYPIRALKEL